jgi:hypothetical protein
MRPYKKHKLTTPFNKASQSRVLIAIGPYLVRAGCARFLERTQSGGLWTFRE